MDTTLHQCLVAVKHFYRTALLDYKFSFGQLVFYLASALVAKIIYDIVYNCYISPLSVIPGPRLCAISRLPTLRRRPKGNVFKWFSSLSKQYGPVVRTAPNMVLFTDKDDIKQILVSDDLPKSATIAGIRPDTAFQTLFTADDKIFHKGRRRLLSPAFSSKYVSSLEPLMHSCVQALLQKIHDTIISNGSEKPARINIYQWVQATAIDVIGETAFGGSFNILENGDHPLPKKIFEELRNRIIRATFPFLRPFLPQDPYTEEFITNIIRERIALNAKGERPHDILQMLIDARDEKTGKGLTEFEMYDQVMEFVIAGSDTSSFTASMSLAFLLHRPQTLRSLVAELEEAFPDVRTKDPSKLFVPNHEGLKNLKLLNAVINETMRRFPVALSGLIRQTTVDTMIGGYLIPKGTAVNAYFNQVQNSKEHWGPDAEEWVPERWLDSNNVPRNGFYGFGAGSRICIGQHFAWTEMRMILASLLLNFDFTLIPNQNLDLVHFITPSLKTKKFDVDVCLR
ncbi:10618_t:CDS:2 [Paraglomus brasilianum]|uniref:10618_t:CDS:1 n=1 Tax=Paraglomus brasilianum TaxID=144538 RepID=A0A9N9C7Z3_9GLOM|nr:10618_t:CDS:2 [Paraglomus brasilianum]